MNERWAIYIDVEGFSAKFDNTVQAFRGLYALMEGVFRIGSKVYPNAGERLFAHQFGDGFLVLSEFPEADLRRPVLIAIALLRHLLANGAVGRAAIAEGDIADVQGCYPAELRPHISARGLSMGYGLMTISPVLGRALINAVSIDKRAPQGPLLSIDCADKDRIPSDARTQLSGSTLIIDWMSGEPEGLEAVQQIAGLRVQHAASRQEALEDYIATNAVGPKWKENVGTFLS